MWSWVFAAFVLAGLTGVAFRLGMVGALPGPLELGDVRHAHSHLMFFGWAAPALMLLIADRLQPLAGNVRSMRRAAVWALAAGFTAYPVFLVSGYGTVAVLGRPVPLSVLVASANGVAWLAFAVAYRRATRGMVRDRALRLWDAAVVFLLLAPVGAMGRGMADATGAEPFWSSSAIHAFLGWFADGWLLLGVLGLAWHSLGGIEWTARLGQRLVVAGLPLSVLAWSSMQGRPPGVGILVASAVVVVGVGVLLLVASMLRPRMRRSPRARVRVSPRTLWVVPLAALALRGIAEPLGLLGFGASTVGGAGHVLYLHLLLLGGVSTGFVTALAADEPAVARLLRAWWTAMAIMLASLVLLTWPVAAQSLAGRWFAVVAAAGPVAVALLIVMFRRRVGGRSGGAATSDRAATADRARHELLLSGASKGPR